LFADRILIFGADAARRYADLAMSARLAGKQLPLPEGYIAAIAAAQGLVVATRAIGPFQATGLSVINLWED